MPTFVTSASAVVGSPINITAYDANGNLLDPAVNPLTWSDLPLGVNVAISGTGYVFNSMAVTSGLLLAAGVGITGSFTVAFTPSVAQFTVP